MFYIQCSKCSTCYYGSYNWYIWHAPISSIHYTCQSQLPLLRLIYTRPHQRKTIVHSQQHNWAIRNWDLTSIYIAIYTTYDSNLHYHKTNPFSGNQVTVKSNTTALIMNSNNKGRTKKLTTEYKVHKNIKTTVTIYF